MAQPNRKSNFESLSRSEWENHLKLWKRSGISKAEYCRSKHISYHGFNYWEKRFEKSKPPTSTSIILVKLGETKMTHLRFSKGQ
jgi:hypothetical protein